MANRILTEISDNPLYLALYQLAREESLEHVLEIGSGSGSGTTRILIEALKSRQDKELQPQLYCLDADPQAIENLKFLYQDLSWVHYWTGYASEPIQFPSPEFVMQYYRQPGNALRKYSQNEVLEWLEREKQRYTQRGISSQGGIVSIRQQNQIQQFDMVLLDGSEFAGEPDLTEVYGAQILVLPGANTFKNQANYHKLLRDSNYVLLQENFNWQNGFAVFKRRQTYLNGISAIVHTRNASSVITDCLDSLSWVDECIVIDMESSDDTVQLATSLGARVAHHVMVNCVDEARNWGLSLVKFSWTLVLDADERIPVELAQQIRDLIHQPQALDGYWLPRRNIFFGQEVPFLFPDYQLRLFRSQKASWRGIVHELPTLTGLAARFPENPEMAIQHFSYANVTDFCQRQLRYAETLWKQMGRFPNQSQPEISADIRKRFETKQFQLSQYLNEHDPDNLEWLVRQLYLFSDLAMSAVLLQNSGQLQQHGPIGWKQQAVKLSAYTYLKNAIRFDYPFIESLFSIMDVCDEVVISYAIDSEDQTNEVLRNFAKIHPKVRIFPTEIWKKSRPDGETIRLAAEEAMAACRGDWLWHVQADEVYTQADARKVKQLVSQYHAQTVHAFRFQVLHFYGDYDHLISPKAQEIGWYQHTIRLARAGKAKHYGDAWTLTLPISEPHAVINTDIRIFHYGHVREHEAMRHKSNYMEKLYHDLPEDFEVCAEGHFQYDKVPPQYLIDFGKVHPEAMLERIARSRLRVLPNGRKQRLLIISRFHKVKKGFGITLNEIYATGLLQAHFQVQQLAWHYEDGPQLIDGIEVWPCPETDKLQALRERLYHFEPDIILLHADAHFFISYLTELASWRGPVVGWFTVDFERAHNPSRLLPLFKRCSKMLSMADVSLQQLRQDYAGPMGKVPLGVNLKIFHPTEHENRQALRQQFGLPDKAFVFLMVANNFWRKGIEYAILALSRFVQLYPQQAQNCLLYLHTEQSESLLELIQAYGLNQYVRISPEFDPFHKPWSENDLARLYQAADAFLLPTLGEGFGMPILEAQASGLPLIISDNSVLREVAGESALFIRCPGYVGGQNAEAHVWMRSPDPDHCAELMYQICCNPQLRQKLSQKGRQQARLASWERTALLLAAELASAVEPGTLEYLPPEPGLRVV